jgi:hypothetical protein
MTHRVPFGSIYPSNNQRSGAMESPAKMPVSRLIAGTILVIAGLGIGYSLQRGWPVILIALGLVRLAMTMRSPRLSGWGLLLLGDWLFMNTMTDWAYERYTWPLLLAGVDYWIIAGGMTRVMRSIWNMERHVA